MTVDISGNTYSTDVKEAVVAKNYKELTGSDVEGILPTEKKP